MNKDKIMIMLSIIQSLEFEYIKHENKFKALKLQERKHIQEKKAITKKTNLYTFDDTTLLGYTEEMSLSNYGRMKRDDQLMRITRQVQVIQDNNRNRNEYLAQATKEELLPIYTKKEEFLAQYRALKKLRNHK